MNNCTYNESEYQMDKIAYDFKLVNLTVLNTNKNIKAADL